MGFVRNFSFTGATTAFEMKATDDCALIGIGLVATGGVSNVNVLVSRDPSSSISAATNPTSQLEESATICWFSASLILPVTLPTPAEILKGKSVYISVSGKCGLQLFFLEMSAVVTHVV